MSELWKRMINTALQRGVQHGLQTAVQATASSAAVATAKSYVQVFTVTPPMTVYVQASMAEVTLRYQPGNQVEVAANLRVAFGWELAAEQDNAGVYIVARRKRLMGQLSSAHFALTVPPEVNLIFNLTPGTVKLINIDGKLAIPAFTPTVRQNLRPKQKL